MEISKMMHAWCTDQLDAPTSDQSENAFFKYIESNARDLGFEFCAYGIQMPIPISKPTTVMFNNYPDAWQQRYNECKYIEIDPIVRHAQRSNKPIVWNDEVFASAPEFRAEAQQHGLRYGWTQASRDPNGAIGMLTLARSSEDISEGELTSKEAQMAWLAQLTHMGMSSMLVPRILSETRAMMTAREKDILRWTAEGKTSYEIARILSISESTVNFHVTKILCKLQATNKTQAAIKAAMLGMLY